MAQRKWGADAYSKWDSFDADDQVLGAGTSFDPGQKPLRVHAVDHIAGDIELERASARVRGIAQAHNEVWQVVVRKLRVWSAASVGADEGEGAVPCRPWCIIVSSLYPDGKLLHQEVCDPPEVFPAARKVVKALVDTIRNPLTGPQRRPRSITFTDEDLAAELFNSLGKWDVEVTQLSEAQGMDEVVSKFSELLVSKDFARVGPTSGHPGCLTGAAVSVDLCAALYKTAARFAQKEPWARIHERRAVEIELLDEVKTVVGAQQPQSPMAVAPGKVWVSVLGHDTYQLIKMKSGKQPGDGAFGVAVFFSKLDMQSRLVPNGEELYISPQDLANQERCSYTGKTKLDIGADLKKTKPRKIDVRTGEELMYSDNDALRKHWPSVRKYAMDMTELEKGRKEKRQYWHGAELALLFEECTSVPFDDLDAIEHHGFEVLKIQNHPTLASSTIPLPLQFNNGMPQRASADQLAWLQFAMALALKVEEDNLLPQILASPKDGVEVSLETDAVTKSPIKFRLKPCSVFFQSEAKAAAMAQAASTSIEQESSQAEDEASGVAPSIDNATTNGSNSIPNTSTEGKANCVLS